MILRSRVCAHACARGRESAYARACVCVYAIGSSGHGRVAPAREGDRVRSLDVAGGERGDCCLVLGMSSDTENTKTIHDLTTPVATPLPSHSLPFSPPLFPSLCLFLSLSLPFSILFLSSLCCFFFSSLFHSLFYLTPRPRRHNVRRSRSSGKEDAWLVHCIMDIREFDNVRLIAPSNDYGDITIYIYRGNDVFTDEYLFSIKQPTSHITLTDCSIVHSNHIKRFFNLSFRGDISYFAAVAR